jgi:hypothetical protein
MRQTAENRPTANGAVEEFPLAVAAPGTDAEQESQSPLTPENFRAVLQEIDSLGLTWSTDLPPELMAKTTDGAGNFASQKLQQIEESYPTLPNELGYVIWYALTGTEPLTDLVGTPEDLQAKAEIVHELLITPEFRDEFLFSQMVKVPFFDNLDWEVVVKTCEQGVQRFPGNAYALVTILMEGNAHYGDKRDAVTFAINETRLERLLATFIDMRDALRRGREISDHLGKHEDETSDAGL